MTYSYQIKGMQTAVDRDVAIVYATNKGVVALTQEQWHLMVSQIVISNHETWNGIQQMPFAFSPYAKTLLTKIFVKQDCIPGDAVLVKVFAEITDDNGTPVKDVLRLEALQEQLMGSPPENVTLLYIYETQNGNHRKKQSK